MLTLLCFRLKQDHFDLSYHDGFHPASGCHLRVVLARVHHLPTRFVSLVCCELSPWFLGG